MSSNTVITTKSDKESYMFSAMACIVKKTGCIKLIRLGIDGIIDNDGHKARRIEIK